MILRTYICEKCDHQEDDFEANDCPNCGSIMTAPFAENIGGKNCRYYYCDEQTKPVSSSD